jgi:hypothetical protein
MSRTGGGSGWTLISHFVLDDKATILLSFQAPDCVVIVISTRSGEILSFYVRKMPDLTPFEMTDQNFHTVWRSEKSFSG